MTVDCRLRTVIFVMEIVCWYYVTGIVHRRLRTGGYRWRRLVGHSVLVVLFCGFRVADLVLEILHFRICWRFYEDALLGNLLQRTLRLVELFVAVCR